MKQKTDEKIDPLTRIQEEIKEVVRREEEYRQLTSALSTPTPTVKAEPFTVTFTESDAATELEQEQEVDEQLQEQLVGGSAQHQDQNQGVLASALLVPIEEQSPSNTPSLASSVNSSHKEESLDDHHSDDSGISSSSLKKNINSNNNNNNSNDSGSGKQPLKLTIVGRQEQRYIGPNCYNLTPEPPQQKLMTRTISTPQLNGAQRQFAFNAATKGVMQRFIASHGKLSPASPILLTPNQGLSTNGISNNNNNNNGNQSPTLKLNSRNVLAFIENGNATVAATPLANSNNNNNISINNNTINGSSTLSQGAIERDSEGRPLRRGYVPVEQKIQRELQDLKSRETELKRLRKLNRQYMQAQQPQSTDDESDANNDDEDSEVEHCYGPGKLRNAQSTVELDRESLDQELIGLKSSGIRSLNMAAALANGTNNNSLSSLGSGMRPAMSLAQLCDLTPEEAPSSHRLIAQWESLIKKNAEGVETAI